MSFPVTKVVRQDIRCEAASAQRTKALRPEGPKNESRVGSVSAISSAAGSGAQPRCSFCLQEKFGQQGTRTATLSRPGTTLLVGTLFVLVLHVLRTVFGFIFLN